VAGQARDLLHWHARGRQQADEAGPQLPGRPVLADAGGPADGSEVPPDVGRFQLGAYRGREDQAGVPPQFLGGGLLLVLPYLMLVQRFDDRLG
jgi:hypothetical protein